MVKPVIARHSLPTQEKKYSVKQGTDGLLVDGSHNGIHLNIVKRSYGNDPTGYEVIITTETAEGQPDFSHILNSAVIDLTPADIEEVADIYMDRLRSGVRPEEMFRDIEEAGIASMREIYDSLTKK